MDWLKKLHKFYADVCHQTYDNEENTCYSDDPECDDISQLKVIELKTVAKERGIKGYSGLKKAELIELLK